MWFTMRFLGVLFAIILFICAKLPELDNLQAKDKIEEILQSHVEHKKISEKVLLRAFHNFLEELDPQKNYFTKQDIALWLDPNEAEMAHYLIAYEQTDFSPFALMHEKMMEAVKRRKEWEKIDLFVEDPSFEEEKSKKEEEWAENGSQLVERWKKRRQAEWHALQKLEPAFQEKALYRLGKQREKFHREILEENSATREKWRLAKIVKAFAGALDGHTSYFTPGEAAQFLISVQQRLFGIGAQLRDDMDGFTVVKVVEGGPASVEGRLRKNDKLVAVNGEPIIGMEISDAIELIRGEEGSAVILTVVRKSRGEEGVQEQLIDVSVPRGEVILKETRYESCVYPCGDGVVAHLRLHSFYQDPQSSSSDDLAKALKQIQREYKVRGVILDLRYNSGGMLTQAIAVTGLFIKKGIVASIKDDQGRVQHLRDLDSHMLWGGPLIVLVNRASASASEIVAQALQDYGRAVLVGDDRTFGKGSFQTFSLHTGLGKKVNPQGEYKVTRGKYYTVSGRTPQLEGVISDVAIPGVLTGMDVGEKFGKYPLESDRLKENFHDDLADVPYLQRDRVKTLYKFDLQPRLTRYTDHIQTLKNNAQERIAASRNYQSFLQEVQEKEGKGGKRRRFGQNDLQLEETMNVMKELILLVE